MIDWLGEVSAGDLSFLQGISKIIQKTGFASLIVDQASKEICKELLDRNKKSAFDSDSDNKAVKGWLLNKKREYRHRETNGA